MGNWVCCDGPQCEENKFEESALIVAVIESLDDLLRKIRRIESKEMRWGALLALFKYLWTVTDLESCGIKLAEISIKIAKKKDEMEEIEDKNNDQIYSEEISGLLE